MFISIKFKILIILHNSQNDLLNSEINKVNFSFQILVFKKEITFNSFVQSKTFSVYTFPY